MLVAEAMTRQPVGLPLSATVARAASAMRDNDIGDVLVMGRGGQLMGIVTDRDIAVRVAAEGKKPSAKLKDVCTTDPICVTATDSLEHAVEMMRENAIRRLPVVDQKGDTVGIVTLGDAATKLDRDSCLSDISRAPANN